MSEETPERPKKIEMYNAKLRQRVEVLEDSIDDYRERGFKTGDEIRKETPPDPPAPVPAPAHVPADPVSTTDPEEG